MVGHGAATVTPISLAHSGFRKGVLTPDSPDAEGDFPCPSAQESPATKHNDTVIPTCLVASRNAVRTRSVDAECWDVHLEREAVLRSAGSILRSFHTGSHAVRVVAQQRVLEQRAVAV
jgi:hypothetical protein